jgi:hypothetical protein
MIILNENILNAVRGNLAEGEGLERGTWRRVENQLEKKGGPTFQLRPAPSKRRQAGFRFSP